MLFCCLPLKISHNEFPKSHLALESTDTPKSLRPAQKTEGSGKQEPIPPQRGGRLSSSNTNNRTSAKQTTQQSNTTARWRPLKNASDKKKRENPPREEIQPQNFTSVFGQVISWVAMAWAKQLTDRFFPSEKDGRNRPPGPAARPPDHPTARPPSGRRPEEGPGV